MPANQSPNMVRPRQKDHGESTNPSSMAIGPRKNGAQLLDGHDLNIEVESRAASSWRPGHSRERRGTVEFSGATHRS